MEKFNLKKAILENKATFFSSLNEGDLVKNIGKGLEYEATEEMIRDYAQHLMDEGSYDVEELAQSYLDIPRSFPRQLDYTFFKNNYDDILSVAMTGLGEGKKEYYKDAEADDAEHIDALEKDMADDKKSSKMKTSELKAKIKEMVLAEMALDVDNMEDAPESEVDFLSEVDAILAEADEEVAVDDTEVAVGGEENIDVDTTTEVDPNVKAVQDALTQAQAAAQKLGDPKLTDQIGNTITFFTRAHVVDKGAVAEADEMEEGKTEDLNESMFPMLKRIIK
jgi:hypothetical protein